MVDPAILFPVWRMVYGQTQDRLRMLVTCFAWNMRFLKGNVKGKEKVDMQEKYKLTRKYPLRDPAAIRGRPEPHF